MHEPTEAHLWGPAPSSPPYASAAPAAPGYALAPPMAPEPAPLTSATVMTGPEKGRIRRHWKKASAGLLFAGIAGAGLAFANSGETPPGNGAVADAPEVGADPEAEFCPQGLSTSNESFAAASENAADHFLHEAPAANQLTDANSLVEYLFANGDDDASIEGVICRNPATLAALTAIFAQMNGPADRGEFSSNDMNAIHRRFLEALNSGDETQVAGVMTTVQNVGNIVKNQADDNNQRRTGAWQRIGGQLDTENNVQIGFIPEELDLAPGSYIVFESIALNDAGANDNADNSLIFLTRLDNGQLYVNESFGNNSTLNIPEDQGPAGTESDESTGGGTDEGTNEGTAGTGGAAGPDGRHPEAGPGGVTDSPGEGGGDTTATTGGTGTTAATTGTTANTTATTAGTTATTAGTTSTTRATTTSTSGPTTTARITTTTAEKNPEQCDPEIDDCSSSLVAWVEDADPRGGNFNPLAPVEVTVVLGAAAWVVNEASKKKRLALVA